MNRKEDILDAWIMVEHLSEGDINLREESVKLLENLENEDYYTLFLTQIKKKKLLKSSIMIFRTELEFRERKEGVSCSKQST